MEKLEFMKHIRVIFYIDFIPNKKKHTHHWESKIIYSSKQPNQPINKDICPVFEGDGSGRPVMLPANDTDAAVVQPMYEPICLSINPINKVILNFAECDSVALD